MKNTKKSKPAPEFPAFVAVAWFPDFHGFGTGPTKEVALSSLARIMKRHWNVRYSYRAAVYESGGRELWIDSYDIFDRESGDCLTYIGEVWNRSKDGKSWELYGPAQKLVA